MQCLFFELLIFEGVFNVFQEALGISACKYGVEVFVTFGVQFRTIHQLGSHYIVKLLQVASRLKLESVVSAYIQTALTTQGIGQLLRLSAGAILALSVLHLQLIFIRRVKALRNSVVCLWEENSIGLILRCLRCSYRLDYYFFRWLLHQLSPKVLSGSSASIVGLSDLVYSN